MIPVLYEGKDIIIVQRLAGLESQVSRRFTSDMVSEIRRYLHDPQDIRSRPQGASIAQPSYTGVIHRLGKPMEGIVVCGLNQKSTVLLSVSLQAGKMEKSYLAVVYGKPVDKQGIYVGYLCHCKENNISKIVDRFDENGEKAVFNYQILEAINNPGKQDQMLPLIGIKLLTGRRHQTRVRFARHVTPLYGDG